jgi:valyl-tRNA synthetase
MRLFRSLKQETDVLDTWFSSALWPFSTMGWPEKTPLLKKFYPTSCLVTGFDILFFWVARMMMMGIQFMDEVPFTDVYIHALVRDAHGHKMSKSKGNVIDPLLVMDKFGTDAFRFTLTAFAAQGRDIKLSEDRIAGYRNFVNKIWNAARFTLMNLEGGMEGGEELPPTLEDRWIISRAQSAPPPRWPTAIEEYRFNDAASAVYQFAWHEFCDWYVELAKNALYDKDNPGRQAAARRTICDVFSRLVRMLHPIMPFVTEELWSRLPGHPGLHHEGALAGEKACGQRPQAEEQMELIMQVIGAVRNIRGEMGLSPAQPLEYGAGPGNDEGLKEFWKPPASISSAWPKASGSAIWMAAIIRPDKSASAALPGVSLYVPLAGLVDFAAEEARLTRPSPSWKKRSPKAIKS